MMASRSFRDWALDRFDNLGVIGWFTGCALTFGAIGLVSAVILLFQHHTSRTLQLITLGVVSGAFTIWTRMRRRPKGR